MRPRATRRSADGRWPVDNGTYCYDVAVQQLHAARDGSGFRPSRTAVSAPPLLQAEELTILTAWAEAVAEILAYAPAGTAGLLADARSGAAWRAGFGLAEPSTQLGQAMDLMSHEVLASPGLDGVPSFDALLSAANEDRPDESQLAGIIRHVLRAVLEERRTRQLPNSAS